MERNRCSLSVSLAWSEMDGKEELESSMQGETFYADALGAQESCRQEHQESFFILKGVEELWEDSSTAEWESIVSQLDNKSEVVYENRRWQNV